MYLNDFSFHSEKKTPKNWFYFSFLKTLTFIHFIGNYTVKVTVTDKDKVSDSALAKVMVIEEPDYPPTANAGEDLIIYLPNNQVTLHGNQSSDDHGIVSWEWTRSGNEQLAADTKVSIFQLP